MRVSFASGALAAGLIAGLSTAPALLSAQPGGVAPACPLDANSPKELAVLELQVQRARGATTPEIRQSALKAIMKELDTKPERFAKNPAGYNLRMAQALTMWALEPGVANVAPRASLGLVTNPTESIDMLVKLDEAYKAIVAALPTCESDVKALRQNDVWLAVTRKALDASNGGQLDSANYYAKRSLLLSQDSPYPHYVLANVANQRKERTAAIGHWKQVIVQSGADTSYRELRNSSLYLLSVNQLEAAEAAKGAEQQSLAKDAAANFKALLSATPDSPDAPNIMQSWADALKMAGDSAAIPGIYADMLAKPAGYGDVALTMAGVIATRVNKTDDAIALNEAAIARNPNARDALRNLAANYYAKDQFLKMLAPSTKLVSIDPNNFDGWMMFAYAAQGIAKAAKVPAEKKAWTDSLVKYQTYAEALPVKVDVASFQRGTKDVSLTLQFEQQAAADGTYSVTVEFLDAAGAVVGTATAPVGPLKKGETKSVAFKAAATGVSGYRYQPIK
ncbi:MAG: tetratricopeptide repeat protein [Gemmatimonadaceae bacterium]|nr:tetratricopeptide repeat protein [Gemmatimonadaceae bacterium]